MKIIGTVGARTYLAETVEEDDVTLRLGKALAFDPDASSAEIARRYVRGTITGKVGDIEITRQNVVSTQDADEVGPLVDLMMKYLPLAEKQARASAVLPELDAMMRATAPAGPAKVA